MDLGKIFTKSSSYLRYDEHSNKILRIFVNNNYFIFNTNNYGRGQ